MVEELSKSRYLYLVERQETLKQKGEELSPSEFKEFFNYTCLLGIQLTYNERFDYLAIFEDYIHGKIDLDHFYCEFNQVFEKVNTIYFNIKFNVEELSHLTMEFEIASKMKQFDDGIDNIWNDYEVYYTEEAHKWFWDKNYKPDFERNINLIHKTYQEIKQCLE